MADASIKISAVDQTKAAIESAKKNLSDLGTMTSSISMKMGSLGVAIGAAFSAGSLIHLIDMLDKLDDMAEKTGINVKTLSELRYAGESVGTTQEQMAAGLTKLARLMGEAAGGNDQAKATFKALGIEINDTTGKLKSTDKMLAEISQRFSGWDDGPEKAALAMRVFGKSGEDMIPLLNLGTAGLQSMAAEAKALGAVYGADVAKNAADFNDNLKKIKMASEAAAIALSGPLVKALGDVSGAFVEAKKSGESYFAMLARSAAMFPKIPDMLGNLPGARFLQILQQGGAALNAPKTTGEIQAYVNRLGGGAGGGRGFVNPRTSAPIVQDRSNVKPPDHFADNFINQLISEYANLTGTVSKYDEVLRKLDTSTEKFAPKERARALTLAGQIDAEKMRLEYEKQRTKDIEAQAAALDKLEDSQAKSAKTFLDNLTDLREGNKDQEFALSLIGQTTEAAEKLRFERELAKKTDDDANRIRKDFVDNLITEAEMQRRLLAIDQERQRALGIYSATRSAEDALKTDPARGMSEALREYQETVRDVAASTKEMWANGIKGMEDALVSFVQTGKLDFRSLADSIIADMIRIQVRQSITGPLAAGMGSGGLGGAFNSLLGLFGQGKYIEGSSSFVGPSQTLTPLQFAEGGRPPLGVPSLIGERGPELFIPDAPGVILPSNKVGGASVTYAPQITIDSRSDRGQVLADVSQLLQRNNEQFAGMLRQQGVI